MSNSLRTENAGRTLPVTHRFELLVAALLCIAVSAIHVDDQGGVEAFADPDWLGWAYRLLEVGGVFTAVALAFTAGAAGARSFSWLVRPVWLAAALVAAGPFVGFVLTRTTGLPGADDDIGNWGEPLGVASLIVEGLLFVIAATALAYSFARRTTTSTRPSPVPA